MCQHFVFNYRTVPGDMGSSWWTQASLNGPLEIILGSEPQTHEETARIPPLPWRIEIGVQEEILPSSVCVSQAFFHSTEKSNCRHKGIATSVRGTVMTQGFSQQSQLCCFFLLGRGMAGARGIRSSPDAAASSSSCISFSAEWNSTPRPWPQSTCVYRRSKIVKGLE